MQTAAHWIGFTLLVTGTWGIVSLLMLAFQTIGPG